MVFGCIWYLFPRDCRLKKLMHTKSEKTPFSEFSTALFKGQSQPKVLTMRNYTFFAKLIFSCSRNSISFFSLQPNNKDSNLSDQPLGGLEQKNCCSSLCAEYCTSECALTCSWHDKPFVNPQIIFFCLIPRSVCVVADVPTINLGKYTWHETEKKGQRSSTNTYIYMKSIERSTKETYQRIGRVVI